MPPCQESRRQACTRNLRVVRPNYWCLIDLTPPNFREIAGSFVRSRNQRSPSTQQISNTSRLAENSVSVHTTSGLSRTLQAFQEKISSVQSLNKLLSQSAAAAPPAVTSSQLAFFCLLIASSWRAQGGLPVPANSTHRVLGLSYINSSSTAEPCVSRSTNTPVRRCSSTRSTMASTILTRCCWTETSCTQHERASEW